jgi:hypothetical protein
MYLDRRTFLALGAIPLSHSFGQTASSTPAPFLSGKGWTPLLNGRDLSGWRLDLGADKVASGDKEWFTATSVSWAEAESPERLRAAAAPGGIIVNGLEARTMNLVTERKFSDFELYLEFLLAKGSNSGVYHHGLYEVQVLDSYGTTRPLTHGDAGGIYERWDNGKGFGGFAPRSNASRPPGQWQSCHTWFRAPRFNAAGVKTADARFERVVYNGVTIHENVVCDGPTRSSMKLAEAAENPLMLQGDHGPVAYRNIYFRPLPLRA